MENFLAIVLAICTAIYTIINFMMLLESKSTRKQKTAPLLIAYLGFTEAAPKSVILYITNVGEGYAKNVKFNIIKDYEYLSGKPLAKRGAFKNGISSFPSKYMLKYFILIELDQFVFDSNDGYVHFGISYENVHGRKIYNEYVLRFDEIIDQNHRTPPETYMGQTAYYLKMIHEEIKKTPISKLKNNSI